MTFPSKLVIGLAVLIGCGREDAENRLSTYSQQYTICLPLYDAAHTHTDSMVVHMFRPYDRYGTNCLDAKTKVDSLRKLLAEYDRR